MIKKRTNIQRLVQTALMAVLIAVCSWLAVPAAIPFTMQTFGVWFAFLFLGAGRGTVAVFLYLLMGLLGLPVYAGGTAGVGVLLGSHGGYMIGWLLAGFVMWLFEKSFGDKRWSQITSMAVSLFVCYAVGTVWFMVVYARETGPVGLWAALLMCVIPFVLPDFVKLALALWLSRKLKKVRHLDT